MIKYKNLQRKYIKFLSDLLNENQIVASLHNVVMNFEGWLKTYNDYWKNDIDEKHFIIFYDETPVGWLKINGLESKEMAWIAMLVILPEYQKKGIGTNAIAFSEEYVKSKGFCKIGIHTTDDNATARKLYEKCGYIITEYGKCTTGDGMQRMGYTFYKHLALQNEHN